MYRKGIIATLTLCFVALSYIVVSAAWAPGSKITQNHVLAGTDAGGDAAPSGRALVNNDLPTVSVAKGGTGATTLTIRKLLMGNTTSAVAFSSPSFWFQDATPTADAADDLWYETDTNILWYWNGTYWLSVQELQADGALWSDNAGLTNAYGSSPVILGDLSSTDIYITKAVFSTYLDTVQSGVNYYTFNVARRNAAGTNTTIGSTTDTQADTAAGYYTHLLTINTFVQTNAAPANDIVRWMCELTPTGTPGSTQYNRASVFYRLAHR